jgi:hypothetical protein
VRTLTVSRILRILRKRPYVRTFTPERRIPGTPGIYARTLAPESGEAGNFRQVCENTHSESEIPGTPDRYAKTLASERRIPETPGRYARTLAPDSGGARNTQQVCENTHSETDIPGTPGRYARTLASESGGSENARLCPREYSCRKTGVENARQDCENTRNGKLTVGAVSQVWSRS